MVISKEEYIRKRRADINNYQNLLKALIVFKKFIENLDFKYYFGGKLKTGSDNEQTPDIIITSPRGGLIGDAKRQLSQKRVQESKEEFIKRYVEGKIFNQLTKYDSKFDNFHVENHDLILFVPQADNESIGIIKFDYLDKNSSPLTRKFCMITYSVELRGNTQKILVKYDYGELTDSKLYDHLRRGISYYTGELDEEIGKYKIYEEGKSSTPIEYVMLILWDSIFGEILGSSNKDNIIKRYRERENKFEVKLSKLMEYLRKIYTLPTYSANENFTKENERVQFKTDIVKEAMDIFCKIDLAKKIRTEDGDTIYEVTLKELPEREELSYFLNKMYDIYKEKNDKPNPEGNKKLDSYPVIKQSGT